MGYQEVFLKGNDNNSTRKLLKAMIREGVRAEEDNVASIICIGRAKNDLKSYCGSTISKNDELIVVTGSRMRSLDDYLSKDNKVVKYTKEEKEIIKKSDYIPLDNIPELLGGYKSNIEDIGIEEFLKDISKGKKNKENER